jgi:hypothetical protein
MDNIPGEELLVINPFDVAVIEVGGGHGLVDVGHDMRPVLQVDGDLDDVHAHVDDMSTGCTIVPSSGVTFQGVGQVSTVKKVITKVVVAASNALLNIVINIEIT